MTVIVTRNLSEISNNPKTLKKHESNRLIKKNSSDCRCSHLGWSACVCQTPDFQYILTNLLVTGGVTDPAPGNKMVCQTRRPRGHNILTGTATPVSARSLVSVPEKMVQNDIMRHQCVTFILIVRAIRL